MVAVQKEYFAMNTAIKVDPRLKPGPGLGGPHVRAMRGEVQRAAFRIAATTAAHKRISHGQVKPNSQSSQYGTNESKPNKKQYHWILVQNNVVELRTR